MHEVDRIPGESRVRKGLLTLLVAGGLAVCPLAGASSFFADFSYMKRLQEAESRVGAPGVFAKLEAMTAQERAAFLPEKRSALNTLMTMRSLSGDYTGAAQAAVWFDLATNTPARYAQHSAALESATAEDALQAIVREAANRQIVILNEAHHVPMTRVFAAKLARELRKIGFDYLAAEAFTLDIPLHPTAVRRDMGFYVMEPMYAGFVRGAMRDGWSFIGYDHYADDMRLREIGAAKNIVDRIFARNPKARVFIFVGHGHGVKQGAVKQGEWTSLATLLKASLGIDPLSIDQATMYGRGDARVDHPLYRAAMQRFAPARPIVLKAPAGGHIVLSGPPGGYDMQVIHPDEMAHSKDGRPVWMARQASLEPHPVPASLLPASGRRLLQAFHAADGEGAVPADMVMVEAGKPAPAFMLPPGQFRFSYEE